MPDEPISVRVSTTAEHLHSLRPMWEVLHKEASGTIFQTYEWFSVWWELHGEHLSPHLVSVWHGEHLVGLFPCYIRRIRFGWTSLALLSLIGESDIYGEFEPLVHPAFVSQVVDAATSCYAKELLTRTIDVIDFRKLPESPFVAHFVAALSSPRIRVRHIPRNSPTVRVELPATQKEFDKRLTYNQRAQLKRYVSVMKRNGVAFEKVSNADSAAAFDHLAELNKDLWAQKGTPSHLLSREHYADFHREFTRIMMKRGAAWIIYAKHMGIRFAGLQVFHVNGQFCCPTGGRMPAHPLNRYSPSLILLYVTICDAIGQRGKVLNLMEGDAEYKLRLGGTRRWLSRLTCTARGFRAWKGGTFLAALVLRDRFLAGNQRGQFIVACVRALNKASRKFLHV